VKKALARCSSLEWYTKDCCEPEKSEVERGLCRGLRGRLALLSPFFQTSEHKASE
jgi:hypothetical protein